MTGAPPKPSDCQKPLPGAPVIGFSDLLCHVRMFKPQFAPLVESGAKCQTVRPTPKRMPKAGDKISLRMWTGKPYRSKHRILREAIITEVEPIRITEICIIIGEGDCSFPLNASEMSQLAKADGFLGPNDMIGWFNFTHGLPFEGIVIKWHNVKAHRRRDDD